MLKFKNSLQFLNWVAISNTDDANNILTNPYTYIHLLMNTFNFRLNYNISSKNDQKPWLTHCRALISILTKQHLERKARNRPDQFITLYTDVQKLSNQINYNYSRAILW